MNEVVVYQLLSGAYLGNILGFLISSYIISINSYKYGGWIYCFYIFGIIGILWYILFILLIFESPNKDPFINQNESQYLLSKNIDNININPNMKIPWKYLFCHYNTVSLYLIHFSYNWSFYTLLTELPSYLNKQLSFDFTSSAVLSVLPFISQFMFTNINGIFIDKLINNKYLTRKNGRILATICCSIIPGIMLVLCGYSNNKTIVIIFLSIAAGFMGCSSSGFLSTYVDISPTLSNIMYAISNTSGTLPGIISPILTGIILGDNPSIDQWRIIFYIAFFVFIIGIIPYSIFIKAEPIPELNYQH